MKMRLLSRFLTIIKDICISREDFSRTGCTVVSIVFPAGAENGMPLQSPSQTESRRRAGNCWICQKSCLLRKVCNLYINCITIQFNQCLNNPLIIRYSTNSRVMMMPRPRATSLESICTASAVTLMCSLALAMRCTLTNNRWLLTPYGVQVTNVT